MRSERSERRWVTMVPRGPLTAAQRISPCGRTGCKGVDSPSPVGLVKGTSPCRASVHRASSAASRGSLRVAMGAEDHGCLSSPLLPVPAGLRCPAAPLPPSWPGQLWRQRHQRPAADRARRALRRRDGRGHAAALSPPVLSFLDRLAPPEGAAKTTAASNMTRSLSTSGPRPAHE